jgi:hypothetical protein
MRRTLEIIQAQRGTREKRRNQHVMKVEIDEMCKAHGKGKRSKKKKGK